MIKENFVLKILGLPPSGRTVLVILLRLLQELQVESLATKVVGIMSDSGGEGL